MKKNSLVQLIIIYIGVTAMYTGISSLITDLSIMFIGFSGSSYGQYNFTVYLIIYLIILLLGFIAITKSGNISDFIIGKSGLDNSLKIYTKPQQLLSILLVVLALSQILDHLPVFMHDVLNFFVYGLEHHTGSKDYSNDPSAPKWFVNALHVLLPCLMIIFCRQLTGYFSKNIVLDDKNIVAEHETITIETTDVS